MMLLWDEAFGEGDVFCSRFFCYHFRAEDSFVICEGEELYAMLHTLRCTLNGRSARYLYAVATRKSHRGRGLFSALHRALLDEAREDLFFLIPEREELRPFYEKRGYRTCGVAPHLAERQKGAPISAEEAYGLYLAEADSLPLVMTREEFLTTANQKRFYRTDGEEPFLLELSDGQLTSFFKKSAQTGAPSAMVLDRLGQTCDEFAFPCFLN